GEILARIRAIIEEIMSISEHHERLAARILKEVEIEGILDPYWEQKAQMLLEMDIPVGKPDE
ncbi:hypothetical protein, partial [Herbaspirillum sp. B65]|uniref:hypothetical protein n=1 Tax=Herbaspirillum sp. B65 TaxID=137708 RepID=UPI001C25F13D